MEVQFNPDLQTKLSRMAAQQGRAAETLVVEAVERLVDHEEWFLQEVDKGIAAADRGEFIDDSDIGKMIPGIQVDARSLDEAGCERSDPHLRLYRRAFRSGTSPPRCPGNLRSIYGVHADAIEIVRILHVAKKWPYAAPNDSARHVIVRATPSSFPLATLANRKFETCRS
jgi:predicted transcriptional regulator